MEEKSIYENYIESMYRETREYLYSLITTLAFDRLYLYYHDILIGSAHYTCELTDDCIKIRANINESCLYDKNKQDKFNRIKLFVPGEPSGAGRLLLYHKRFKCTKVTDDENIHLFLDIASTKED